MKHPLRDSLIAFAIALIAFAILLKAQTAVINGPLTLQGGAATFTVNYGTINPVKVADPAAPTVTPQSASNQTWGYKIVGITGTSCTTTGQTTARSAEGTTATGWLNLTLANQGNVVSWTALAGAAGYCVYRTTVPGGGTPSTTGLIATVSGGGTVSYTDAGAAGDSTNPLTVNTTASILSGITNMAFNTADTGAQYGVLVQNVNPSPTKSTTAGEFLNTVSGALPANQSSIGFNCQTNVGNLTSVGAGQVVVGCEPAVNLTGTGQTLPDVRAVTVNLNQQSGSTTNVTLGSGITVQTPSLSGSGTWATIVGVDIQNQTGGTASYSIRTGTSQSRFNGNVGIGADPGSTIALDVTANAGANSAAVLRAPTTASGVGGQIQLVDSTANKSTFIRQQNGTTQVINNAYGAVTWAYNDSGAFTTYNSVATVGSGLPSFTGQVLNTGFSTTQTGQTILASSVASQYRIGYTLYESANGSGGTCNTNATVTPAITYQDPNSQTHTFTAGAISLTPTAGAGTEAGNCLAATGSGGCEILRHVKTGTAITITYTYANGNCNTQPQATAKAYAEVVN